MEKIEIKKPNAPKAPAVLVVLAFMVMSLSAGYYFLFMPKDVPVVVEEPKTPAYCLGEYESEICKYDWEPKIAIAIMYAESGGNPNALGHNTNGTVDFGLFQINEIHLGTFTLEDVASPKNNIKTAYKLWDLGNGVENDGVGDWRIWSVFADGTWYEHYVKLGQRVGEDTINE